MAKEDAEKSAPEETSKPATQKKTARKKPSKTKTASAKKTPRTTRATAKAKKEAPAAASASGGKEPTPTAPDPSVVEAAAATAAEAGTADEGPVKETAADSPSPKPAETEPTADAADEAKPAETAEPPAATPEPPVTEPARPEPPAAEPAAAAPSPAQPSEPIPAVVKYAAAVFVLLVGLIVGASLLNTGKYYLVAHDGAVEIWQGRFSPKGSEPLLIMPGVQPPAEIKPIYSRQEVFPLAFNYYLQQADEVLQTSGSPDFDEIKSYLNRALSFATTAEEKATVNGRLKKIDRTLLIYRSDLAAAGGTPENLRAARSYLKQAAALGPDEIETNLINQKLAAIEQRLNPPTAPATAPATDAGESKPAPPAEPVKPAGGEKPGTPEPAEATKGNKS